MHNRAERRFMRQRGESHPPRCARCGREKKLYPQGYFCRADYITATILHHSPLRRMFHVG